MRRIIPVLIYCSVFTLACAMGPAVGPLTPIPATTSASTASPESSSRITPSPAPLLSPKEAEAQSRASLAACQKSIDPILEAMQQMDLPIFPIAHVDTVGQFSPTATPASTWLPQYEIPVQVGDVSQLDVDARNAGDYLVQHQDEGVDGLRRWLVGQKLLCENPACPASVAAADLDMDGDLEYVMTLTPDAGPNTCTHRETVQSWPYILDCQFNSSRPDCRVTRLSRPRDFDQPNSCIEGIYDITGDDRPELLVSRYHCGASDCFNGLDIVSQKASSYVFLNPDFTVHNGCIAGINQPGTSQMEFFLSNSRVPGSAGMQEGAYRYTRDVLNYQWNGGQFVLTGRAFEIRCQSDIIVSGVEWAFRGEPETAVAFFDRALALWPLPEHPSNNCGDYGKISPAISEAFLWTAYAKFSMGILQARLGRGSEARATLSGVRALDDEGTFASAADVFLTSYSGGSYTSACADVLTFVGGLPDQSLIHGPFKNSPLPIMCPGELR